MHYHILNGDCLASQLAEAGITDNIIVCRECMIEGPLKPNIDKEFWRKRAGFIGDTYNETEAGYQTKVRSQFDIIATLPKDAEVNLWFEDDLFCQANMWLILHLLHQQGHQGAVYRVFPVMGGANHWLGFGASDAVAIQKAFEQKVLLTADDIKLGADLWQAYASNDLDQLASVSKTNSNAFNLLPEVVQAHIDRSGNPSRPVKAIQEIMAEGKQTFKEVFPEFTRRQGIYGFGDLQVKRLFDEALMQL